MGDHINISDPTSSITRMGWEHRLEKSILLTKLEQAERERDHWRDQIAAIFTRIRCGDDVWLTDDEGGRIVVGALTPAEDPQ